MDDYYLVDEGSDEDSYTTGEIEENDLHLEAIDQIDDANEEDDFEEEMEKERKARSLNFQLEPEQSAGPASSSTQSANAIAKIEEEDELLYDPNADEEDQDWANKQLATASRSMPGNQARKCSNSDAVLNCPGCMSLLSLDCQRHEKYVTQYRAMFVFNCDISFGEKLTHKEKRRKFTRSERGSESIGTKNETYYNVNCSVCSTQVAVYDRDEVYHFFNVLSSYT
ncbi:E2F-associated phosphoprotein [Halotydeus destructor]|nr:E2F-associated phosphoprotein [Halotydeus destructor]